MIDVTLGSLFSSDFLCESIVDLEDWQTFDNVEIVTLEEQLRVIFDQFPSLFHLHVYFF